MAEEFKKYLATEILSEQRTVSYRNVSRALKLHVNAAKCMLYEFYQFQNAKKPGSVHATYLLCGTKKPVKAATVASGTTNGHKHHYDEDEPIPSSPPPFTSSMLDPSQQSSQGKEDEEHSAHAPVRTITLVREEALEALKEQYETITSIHIYSLSPTRIQDLVTLTEISRGLFTDVFTKEDPLLHNKTYGVIQNPSVRRRQGKKPVIPQGPPPKFQPVKDDTKSSGAIKASSIQNKVQSTPTTKHEEASRPSSRDSTSTNGSAKKPALKRDSSDLFKAFAKQGQQKPKPAPSVPAAKDSDANMGNTVDDDDDEGESEDESLFLDTETRKPGTTKKRPSDAKRDREDKAAKLRKMMESDDEDEPVEPKAEEIKGIKQNSGISKKDTEAGEDDEEEIAWSDSDSEKQRQATSKEDKSTAKTSDVGASASNSEPCRRRGKRKVMKKRTMKDEDGYLVTREEAVWESYSEDDAEPTPAPLPRPAVAKSTPKMQSQSQGQSQGSAKGAKSAGKKGAGGGNIMSFFGKKN